MLVVIDALKPSMLERAIANGRAPALARIRRDGCYVDDCVAAFPSVTPVCAATITTGAGPDGHGIPSMNWYHREEGRYVEYGSSFSASRQFGVLRSLTDTVYRMNAEHLSTEVETVYESLDDADVRTAGTTYLIYRGRYEHEVSNETALARIVTSTLFRRTILGPRELFYADLYASRKTGCRGQLGMPGIRDQHTGCVGAYLVENDLFDFMLFSLPDNDAWSHKNGPHAQVTSIAAADRQLERLMHAAGGPDAFLDEHAVIVTSDHSQAAVEERIRLDRAFAEFDVATRSAARSAGAEVALSPAQRAAMIYALDLDRRDELVERSVEAVREVDGVDLVLWLAGPQIGRRRSSAAAAASSGSRPAIRCWTIAAGAGTSRATCPRCSARSRTGASCAASTRTRWPASGRRSSARTPATSCCRRRPATSSSTGAEPTTSAEAATGRCTARIRSAPCCGAAPARRRRPSGHGGRYATSRPMVREHFAIRDGASRLGEAGETRLGAD